MPEEIRIFVRSAAFGIAIAVVYWFVSYDVIGTVLLLGFGVAGLFLAGILVIELRRRGHAVDRRPWAWIGLDPSDRSTLYDEVRRLPSPSVAPLLAGLGVSLAALGTVYGPALVLAGAPLLLAGGVSWWRAAMAEFAATDDEDRREGDTATEI